MNLDIYQKCKQLRLQLCTGPCLKKSVPQSGEFSVEGLAQLSTNQSWRSALNFDLVCNKVNDLHCDNLLLSIASLLFSRFNHTILIILQNQSLLGLFTGNVPCTVHHNCTNIYLTLHSRKHFFPLCSLRSQNELTTISTEAYGISTLLIFLELSISHELFNHP